MVNSGSRKRTRKVCADVLDRLASREGADSRARKQSTRKVSAHLLDTLRDHTNVVPSAPQTAARTPGYGIIRRARTNATHVGSTQEHGRLTPPSPPDTGPTPGVDLRRAVDLAPPPLREPGTDPCFVIGPHGAGDGDPIPVDGDIRPPITPAAMDDAEFFVLSSPPPAQILRRHAAAAHTQGPEIDAPDVSVRGAASPTEALAPAEPARPGYTDPVVADAVARLRVRRPRPAAEPVEALPVATLPIDPQECSALPDTQPSAPARRPRTLAGRIREFVASVAAVWRSTR